MRELQARRDSRRVRECFAHLENVVRRGKSALEAILAAVDVYTTPGEISGTRATWGTYQEVTVF